MRTNIEIDDALLAEAMAATGLKTKRKVVEAGLRLLARHKRQVNARQLFAGFDGRAIWIESACMTGTMPIAVLRVLIDRPARVPERNEAPGTRILSLRR